MAEETPGKLHGLRIAITREQPGELATWLSAQGATVVHAPLIRVVAAPGEELLHMLASHSYDWVVFTSGNALRFVVVESGVGPSLAPGGRPGKTPSVACVGESTAEEARGLGLRVDLVPKRQHIKGLLEAFAALPDRGRVLYPRSEIAPSTLKEGLQALGFVVDDPVVYRTYPDKHGMQAFAAQLKRGLDAVVFASPSAVRYAVEAVGDELNRLRLYSIGPSTSEALRQAGLTVAAEASEHSTAGLAQAILAKESSLG
ncbi:MAG: uroporphyrinogen-III synthase [Planctomycetes bacterium]|nr:uroporphyrinogen-III synthase [Planctomycetota bacterium]MCB9934815.1 uroporphyrinogen-III synthase [Planctomycetota bacterium]